MKNKKSGLPGVILPDKHIHSLKIQGQFADSLKLGDIHSEYHLQISSLSLCAFKFARSTHQREDLRLTQRLTDSLRPLSS
jgi:hypothetical protein